MSICLLVITDGRIELLDQTIKSAEAKLSGPISHKVIINDSGHSDAFDYLMSMYGPNTYGYRIFSTGTRSGFGGAIRKAWQYLKGQIWFDEVDYIFHLEDDFLFHRYTNLQWMSEHLRDYPQIQQIALLRQPWNEQEKAAGGVWQQNPEDYYPFPTDEPTMLIHRRFWTTNPCLYRAKLILEREWPDCEHSEGIFGIELFSNPDYYSAFWGLGEEWVTHIGNERVGTGY